MTNKKILIVGPAWVGDMVMAQCLFKLLKQQQPNVMIDVLAPAWSAALLTRMPEVNSAIVMPLEHGELRCFTRYRLAKSLVEKKYDQAIVLPNSFKSALVPWWANIPLRTGWRGEMRFFVLNDRRKLDKKRYPLMIERFMALRLEPGQALPEVYPYPELIVSAQSQATVLAKYDLDYVSGKLLVLCPGAEFGPAKRWPESYYAEVANSKLEEGWTVWLLGSAKDTTVTESINKLTQDRCKNLAGCTSLAESIDLLALATAVISNDSGLLHVAAALKKPVIAVYGPTSAVFTPPLFNKATVLTLKLDCQPCFQRACPLQHHRCMLDLKPARVLEALSELTVRCMF